MDYSLKRSRRRTLSVEITRGAGVVVRAPLRCPQREIDRFLEARRDWISEHLERRQKWMLTHPEPDEARCAALRRRASEVIPARVAHYAAVMGLFPSGVAITGARMRFGSCSPANRLCFSFFLMQYPPEAVDCVVVHELAHIAHKNHGAQFYALVESVLPDYRRRLSLLRD